jgi:hypothetical protein
MEVVGKKRKGQKPKGWDLYRGTKIETQINIPHEKCPFLLDMDFFVKEIKNPT